VRRVSNAVNISGVSNDKRMFTRVQTHPDRITLSFFYSQLIAKAGPSSQEYFTDIKDSHSNYVDLLKRLPLFDAAIYK